MLTDSQNLLKLPKDANVFQIENPRITINDPVPYKFRDVCKFLPLLIRVFKGEWTGLLVCLVKKVRKPYHNPKSIILNSIIDGDSLASRFKSRCNCCRFICNCPSSS